MINKIYKKLVSDIYTKGFSDTGNNVSSKYKDGSTANTAKLHFVNFTIDNREESTFPIIASKNVNWKWAIEEILWIWRGSNKIADLKKNYNITIWDEWEGSDGTIGKAYGYQLSKKCRKLNGEKVNQVEYLLHCLKNKTNLRRNIVTLWNVDDMDEMNLPPCVHTTHWMIDGDYLDIKVNQRSCDTALGLPYNITQYAFLHRLIARETGLKPRDLFWSIDDAHIYERHIDTLIKQISYTDDLDKINSNTRLVFPHNKGFYDLETSMLALVNYNYLQSNSKYELAISGGGDSVE